MLSVLPQDVAALGKGGGGGGGGGMGKGCISFAVYMSEEVEHIKHTEIVLMGGSWNNCC